MKIRKIEIYLVILCIIFSIGYFNRSTINTQEIEGRYNYKNVEYYHVRQNDYSSSNIITKTNKNQFNNKSVQKLSRLQDVTSIKASSNITGFISTWNTSILSSTSSDSVQITLPLVSNGIYNFTVLWGDGSSNLITTNDRSAVTHIFNSPGIYTVNITGTIIGWRFNGEGDAVKLIQISNWGPLRLGNNGYYFSGASNLVITANDALDLNGTTDLAGMFENCYALGNSGDLNSWDVSQVTDMANMFKNLLLIYGGTIGAYIGKETFNQSLNSWNVSQVTDMSGMFFGDQNFNQPLNSWNVSQVIDMSWMLSGTRNFNQPLNSWNVSHVTDMSGMFSAANTFNKPLNSWNVSEVTNMSWMFAGTNNYSMFSGANNFDQALNSWNVSHVTDMSYMFYNATKFNQPLNSWNVSKVNNMSHMFKIASNFNQHLDTWNVSQVTDMTWMFSEATEFNQQLNSWNVSQVTDMTWMFAGATKFNQPLNSWNVSRVIDMGWMFNGTGNFNQPLDSWDVSHVINMNSMFSGATKFNQSLDNWNVSQVNDMSSMFAFAFSFNQSLGGWNVSQVTKMAFMFDSDQLSISNYDQLLLGWSSLPNLQHYVIFDAGNSQYNASAQNAREKLIKNFNWAITDGGINIVKISKANSLIPSILIFISGLSVFGISVYVSIAYFEYKKTKNKNKTINLGFRNYLINSVSFKKFISKNIIAPILILLGGVLAIFSVFPNLSDFFPLGTFSFVSGGGGPPIITKGYINFWGTTFITNHRTLTLNNAGWTFLGISPIVMALIFALLGIIAIIIAIDGFKKFIPKDTIRGEPFLGSIGNFVGIVDLIMVLLMYFGNSKDPSHMGFTPAQPYYLGTFTIGLGYYFLILSCILIILGAITNIIISKKKGQTIDFKIRNYLKDNVKFKRHETFVPETLSSETFDKIEKIIDENKEK